MVGLFWEAARPKTLGAGVVCVLVGTAAAGSFIAWRFVAAMVASVAVQVAVNYANDYFDAVKGVDTVQRTGPRRITSAGLVTPGQMRLATGVALGVASVPGLALAAALGPQVIVVGLFCFAAALGYSGGPRPFASLGLGEVFVFVFFGIVGTVGAAYVQTGHLSSLAFAVAVPVGALASALLLANNIRDIDTDAAAGKATLAVRIGRERARAVFGGLFAAAFAGTPSPWPWCHCAWSGADRTARVSSRPSSGPPGCSLSSASCWRWACGGRGPEDVRHPPAPALPRGDPALGRPRLRSRRLGRVLALPGVRAGAHPPLASGGNRGRHGDVATAGAVLDPRQRHRAGDLRGAGPCDRHRVRLYDREGEGGRR